MRQLLYIFAALVLCTAASAQDTDSLIVAHSYRKDAGMQLKWLPRSYKVFAAGFENGYDIYRAEASVSAGSEKLSDFVKLTAEPVRPWTDQRFIDALPQDSTIGIAGMFLSSRTEILSPAMPATVRAAVDAEEAKRMQLFLAMFSAASSNKVADVLGLYWIDATASPNTKYIYRIQIHGAIPYTALDLVLPASGQPREKVMGLVAKLDPGTVHLSWFNNGGRTFPYYNIYRSESKGKGYTKLNDAPYTASGRSSLGSADRTFYTDSFPTYNKTYYYKVIGVDVFGDEGIPSDVKEIKAYYLLTQAPEIVSSESNDNKTIKLTWKPSVADAPYLAGYAVFRAPTGEGPYRQVHADKLSPKSLTFTDLNARQAANFYTVCAYGQSGDSMCSILKSHFLVDSFPPAKPQKLAGICDTLGIIRLSWQRGSETDLLGYRVFRTYMLDKEPVRKSAGHITDSVFVDTVSLNEPYNKIYYRISAIDQNGNASVPSDYAEVRIPDINPPTNGYFTGYEVTDKGIHLQWQPSNAYDLHTMYLMRKSKYDFDYQPILTLTGDSLRTNSYTDTVTQSGQTYSYALMAEDEWGLRSELSPVMGITQMRKEKRPQVTDIKALVNRDNQLVKLAWTFDQPAVGFRLYRSMNNGPMEVYTFVTGDQREFYDKWVRPNTTYTYQMMAELDGGYRSAISPKLEVKY